MSHSSSKSPQQLMQAGCLCCAQPSGVGTVKIEGSKNPLQTQPDTGKNELRLQDFRPRSMLQVPRSHVERPRFPVIDVHAHLTWSSNVRNGVSVGEEVTLFARPEDLLPVMDRKGVRTLVNLTANWHWTEAATLFLEARNLGNSRFEPANGFVIPGRSLLAGVRVGL